MTVIPFIIITSDSPYNPVLYIVLDVCGYIKDLGYDCDVESERVNGTGKRIFVVFVESLEAQHLLSIRMRTEIDLYNAVHDDQLDYLEGDC